MGRPLVLLFAGNSSGFPTILVLIRQTTGWWSSSRYSGMDLKVNF
jgi:hypothetical protein